MDLSAYPSDGFPQRRIEGSSGGDDLREAGGSRKLPAKLGSGTHIGDPMKCLRPPFIVFDPKARHGLGSVHQQLHLLLQRQPSDQVPHSHMYRQLYAAKRQVLGACVLRVASE